MCITGSFYVRLQKFTRFEKKKTAKVTMVQNLLMNVLVLLAIGSSLSSGQTTPKNVICYLQFLSLDLPDVTTYTISDIDASLCTHVVYHSVDVDKDKLTLREALPFFNHSSVWKEFVNLRLANPSLKVILSMDDYSSSLGAISNDDRQTFINNVVELLRRWDFDGIEHWWRAELKQPFANLLEEMRAAFAAEATSSGRDPLILTVTLSNFGDGVDVQRVVEAVDIVHVHANCYSLGYLYDQTGLSAPLYGNWSNRISVSQRISSILDAGVPPEKVHMTIQFFAMTFTLSDPEITGVGAPAIPRGEPGEYTKTPGELAYYEVCKRLQEGGYTVEVDPEGLMNFAYKGDQWMTYEDPASIEIKMSYVYEHNLGGVTAWFLNEDDYTGQFCNQGRYPLLSTLYNYRQGCPDGQVFDSSKGYCVETTCRIITIPKTEP